MIMASDIRYLYGTKDGFFHFGKRLLGSVEVLLQRNQFPVITWIPEHNMFKDEEINNVTLEDFMARNIAGFYMNNCVPNDLDLIKWQNTLGMPPMKETVKLEVALTYGDVDSHGLINTYDDDSMSKYREDVESNTIFSRSLSNYLVTEKDDGK